MSLKSQLSAPLANLGDAGSPLMMPAEPEATHSTTSPEKAKAVRPGLLFQLANSTWESLLWQLDLTTNRFVPASCANSPEDGRRARLICRFGHLGAIFGILYALFYVFIGHKWGALVVVVCSTGFELAPWLMKRTGSLDLAGNLLPLILILGFSTLCCLEGGLQGHAIAWLASVPLCALLLLGRQGAGRWMIASFTACALIVALNLMGVALSPTYDRKWESLVSAAGYLGFIVFMFILGVIFETGRKRAFGKMQEALVKLEMSNTELVRLNQEKNEFLGIAAHDLKNPLGVVIGTAELLRICRDEAKTDRLIGNIVGAGTRMLDLVKNLLDANAIEQGRFISHLERCDLQALARECVDANLLAATQKEIRLLVETDAACWVRADRNAAMQILVNLVSNAVKYSPRKTSVHLRTGVEGDRVFFTIRDEGPGISGEDLKKMFGKFTRLSARPTGGESSNGLGLSIVKRLAEAMAGTVRCESRLGEGATFVLQLPAWREPPRA